jgi:hypothetical protein
VDHKASPLKSCLVVVALVVAGWGLIILAGYAMLRGILSVLDD